MTAESHSHKPDLIRCHCGTPVAERQRGDIVIVSRHHGERHVNVIKGEDGNKKPTT